MSRDDGFAIADIDTGLLADPKIVALARRLRDPVQTAAHVALYVGLILESWGAGERLTFDAALPAWWLEDAGAIRANLAGVGLIDESGRLPDHAWTGWYEPARNRREARRAAGSKGGQTKPRSSNAPTSLKPRSSDAQATLNPTGPTGPVRPRPAEPSPPLSARHGAREIGVDRV